MSNDIILLDRKLDLAVNISSYQNELNGLLVLRYGLTSIFNNLRPREIRITNDYSQHGEFSFYGNYPGIDKTLLNILPSMFYWFSISLTNYARLLAVVNGKEKGLLQIEDFGLQPNRERIKRVVNEFVKGVPEIQSVVKWRNKVAAHFALTDPRSEDNIATLESSILYPVGFEKNRFFTSTITLTKGDSKDSFSSELPRWSISEVYETLAKERLWFDIGT